MRKICFGTVMVNLKPENNYQVHLVEIYPNKASGKKQINFSGTPEEVRSYMKTYMNQNNLFSNTANIDLYKNQKTNGFYGYLGARHTLRYNLKESI